MTEAEGPAASPAEVVAALLNAVLTDDQAEVAQRANLPVGAIASLRTRHSAAASTARLEPEFTIVDGDRVTTAVWLPVVGPPGVLDLYTFDSFVVVGGRVTSYVTSAITALDYTHMRTQVQPRRPLPEDAHENDVPARRAELVAGFNRDVFEAGDPEAVDRYVTEDYHQHAEWRGPSGRQALAHIVEGIRDRPPPAGRPAPEPLFVTVQGAIVAAAAQMGPAVAFDAYLVRGGLLAEHWSGIDPRWHP